MNTPIDQVWEFYTHIEHLSIITPKEVNLKVLNSTDKKFSQGTQFWIQGKILLYTSKWHSIIRSITPYEYVDEMLSGPFKKWVHVHKFHDIELNQTEVVDEVEFELPYGILGRMLDGFAIDKLKKVFSHRRKTTIERLEND
ncbi:MAG: SRPBCC family protein [Nitrososphaeraceae archaeon]